jgi:hypothetical protein
VTNEQQYRRDLIAQFTEDVDSINISITKFRRCFPDEQSIAEFIRTTGLHIHMNDGGMDDPSRVTISEHSEDPWG